MRGAPHRVAFGFASPDDESRSVSPERGAARIARMADTESDRAVAAELQAQADAETPLIATPTSTPVPVVVAGEVAPQQQYVGHGPYAPQQPSVYVAGEAPAGFVVVEEHPPPWHHRRPPPGFFVVSAILTIILVTSIALLIYRAEHDDKKSSRHHHHH